jgi:hypothetical protein
MHALVRSVRVAIKALSASGDRRDVAYVGGVGSGVAADVDGDVAREATGHPSVDAAVVGDDYIPVVQALAESQVEIRWRARRSWMSA